MPQLALAAICIGHDFEFIGLDLPVIQLKLSQHLDVSVA